MESHDNETAAKIAIENLRIAAFRDDVTNIELAEKMHMHRQTIGKLLRSDDMSLETFLALADELHLNPAELIEQARSEAKQDLVK